MVHVDELRKTAFDAEKDLNSYQAKQGLGRKSDSTLESGVDEMVDQRFAQSGGVKYGPGSTASGSDHRKIPEDEGGTRDDRGRLAKGEQYLGEGGPETNIKKDSESRPGDQDTLNLQEMKQRGIAE
ncbi:Uncharacterized protein PECH_000942 [Penicillium ucsense]|uniref:Uncharacterized protein n=2 Tax=Penicillium TaxID=5073 RepID=A0A8J8WMC5_9EURO|nr:uncharacterized protein N7539_007525 [Penicillium diatomitis]KAF7719878.1 Uncharacterized protein PECM_003185 [Penicillium ucsense]KAF7733213.1 Uncharacterized protein PECH_000942 [Penicillium ucsense]KAJ5477381.1 hypothetical protein N7539_007525 [Penicillium diatomitis]